jgi:hypothetical protein
LLRHPDGAGRHLKEPEKSAPILAKKCAADAKKIGLPLEELEEVVIDIEQAITTS